MTFPSPDAALLRVTQRLYDHLLDEYGMLVGHYRAVAVSSIALAAAVYGSRHGPLGFGLNGIGIGAYVAFAYGHKIARDLRDQRAGRAGLINRRAMRESGEARAMSFIACGVLFSLLGHVEVALFSGVPFYAFWLTQAVMVRERRPPARQPRMVSAGASA